jgi:DeoR/GlpR family transcriptional regulator of sugar metabolism
MIKSSGKVVALATPEKLNTAEAFHIADIQALNGMITSSPNSICSSHIRKQALK